ncbi:MAG: 3-isopropylmalate dehydrogenase [candidate division KSB1 bacterium]|nr:3-isopropylmalate dehydrogenase [candidate division KSB1 bacterium]
MQTDTTITVLPGDGIGPEVTAEAVKVLKALAGSSDLNFEFNYADVGGCAVDKHNTPLPKATLEQCKSSDAVLMGAIGAPQYDELPGHLRPERGLLDLRKGLGLYANLRPARVYPALASASTLKPEYIENVDILIVRELTGGIYFGTPQEINESGGEARSTMVYQKHEIKRIARVAFKAAGKRGNRVCSVDKANVLDVSKYWRRIVKETATEYPDIELSHMYVDNCAMQLVRYPAQFDVIVTGNMFGDILSDEASMLTGSLGMLPSASLGDDYALYEPVHGSAPDIAGQGKANPIATIASAAMMLQYTLNRPDLAETIEQAIETTLIAGCRTADIAMNGETPVSTADMGQEIVKNL